MLIMGDTFVNSKRQLQGNLDLLNRGQTSMQLGKTTKLFVISRHS